MNEQTNSQDNSSKSDKQSDVRRVLDLLHEGKVTVNEAERLIGALSPNDSTVYQINPTAGDLPKFLIVEISSGTDEVNLRVPVKLLSLGVDLSTLNPQIASAIEEAIPTTLHGLAGLKDDALRQALQGLTINIQDEEDSIHVYCE